MSFYDYRWAQKLMDSEDPPFYGLIMAALRRADSANVERIRDLWPEVFDEMVRRYNAPGGLLPGEVLPPPPEGEESPW